MDEDTESSPRKRSSSLKSSPDDDVESKSNSRRKKHKRTSGDDNRNKRKHESNEAGVDDDKENNGRPPPSSRRSRVSNDEGTSANGFFDGRNINQPNKPPEAGVISKIYVENFMCHKKLTVELCRNINFIYGQNGSGKSAILAAIQVCLGAGARRTNRARNLKGMVRKGTTSNCARIRVTLLNQGDDSFKHDIYGDFVTVERTIAIRGGYNGYKLFDANLKERSRSKKELDEMLDKLNIQVENPVALLDQEEACHGYAQPGLAWSVGGAHYSNNFGGSNPSRRNPNGTIGINSGGVIHPFLTGTLAVTFPLWLPRSIVAEGTRSPAPDRGRLGKSGTKMPGTRVLEVVGAVAAVVRRSAAALGTKVAAERLEAHVTQPTLWEPGVT